MSAEAFLKVERKLRYTFSRSNSLSQFLFVWRQQQ